MHYQTLCLDCAATGHAVEAQLCHACGGPLGFRYDTEAFTPMADAPGMWRFRRLLPLPLDRAPVSLGEGATPLLASRLALSLPVDLRWKDETRNPTGSHKDRALSVALSHAVSIGARTSLVVSAGSTGLSNAAYAARAGLGCITVVARGTPVQRLLPLVLYGARLVEVDAGIDEAIAAAAALAGRDGLYVASTTRTTNAHQAEGAKTIALEIVEALGDAPDWVLVPTGGGGTVAGIWRGFLDAKAVGLARRLPRLAAIVPRTHDALAAAHAAGIDDAARFADLPYSDDVETILTKLAHAHPPDGIEALAAIRAADGVVVAVDETAAIAGTGRIAAADGLFLEPSSGVLAPALDRLLSDGAIPRGASVVGLACGSGFRETFALPPEIAPTLRRVALGDLGAALSGAAPG